MRLARFAVIAFGAGFLLLGLVAAVGPGFPIAESEPRSPVLLYTQAIASLSYGSALMLAAFVTRPVDPKSSPIAWLLLAAPLALWALSAAPISRSLVFLPIYAAVSGAAFAVLLRRRATPSPSEGASGRPR